MADWDPATVHSLPVRIIFKLLNQFFHSSVFFNYRRFQVGKFATFRWQFRMVNIAWNEERRKSVI